MALRCSLAVGSVITAPIVRARIRPATARVIGTTGNGGA